MNIAVIYSTKNKRGKKDATGAFIPEARAFQLVHGISDNNMIGINCISHTMKRRYENLISALYAIGRNEPLDAIVFFGHGWPNGIQFGLTKKNVSSFVYLLVQNRTVKLTCHFALYTCLTAENEIRDKQIKNIGPATKGGFADQLAYRLGRMNIAGHVDAHKTSGHTTWNPYVVRFQNTIESPRAAWLVEPGSESWKNWVKAVRGSNLRFEFPFMSEFEIKQTLQDDMVVV